LKYDIFLLGGKGGVKIPLDFEIRHFPIKYLAKEVDFLISSG